MSTERCVLGWFWVERIEIDPSGRIAICGKTEPAQRPFNEGDQA
jgi:hypothetical protein